MSTVSTKCVESGLVLAILVAANRREGDASDGGTSCTVAASAKVLLNAFNIQLCSRLGEGDLLTCHLGRRVGVLGVLGSWSRRKSDTCRRGTASTKNTSADNSLDLFEALLLWALGQGVLLAVDGNLGRWLDGAIR